MGMELDRRLFDIKVKHNPVLVLFYKKDCKFSRNMSTKFTKLEVAFPIFSAYRVNAESYPDIARHYGVSQVPTIVFFKFGKEIAKIVGDQDMDLLKEKIGSHFDDYISKDEEMELDL